MHGLVDSIIDLIKVFAFVAGIIAFARTFRHDDELIAAQKEIRHLKERLKRLELKGKLPKKQKTDTEKSPPHKIVVKPSSNKSDDEKQRPQQADKIPSPVKITASTNIASSTPNDKAAYRTASSAEQLESSFGTKWSIWLGGISLALGSIFMIRFSLEQGLIGPGMRVIFGILLSAALLVGGEKLRKRDLKLGQKFGLDEDQSAYIPGVLTAAGIIAGFATIYGSYALYHFIPPLIAMLLMAAMSIGGFVLSAHQGAKIAALGLIGSYITPALVSTGHPNA